MLPDVVLEVLLATLVGDLSQPGLLARECLVQVKQLQLGVIQVTKLGRKHGSLRRPSQIFTGQVQIMLLTCNGGNGVSNWGVIRRSGSCFIPSSLYALIPGMNDARVFFNGLFKPLCTSWNRSSRNGEQPRIEEP